MVNRGLSSDNLSKATLGIHLSKKDLDNLLFFINFTDLACQIRSQVLGSRL